MKLELPMVHKFDVALKGQLVPLSLHIASLKLKSAVRYLNLRA